MAQLNKKTHQGVFVVQLNSRVPHRRPVEHRKRNQTATSQWPVGFDFCVQLDYSCWLKSVLSDAEEVLLYVRLFLIAFSYSPQKVNRFFIIASDDIMPRI